jgi:hypothetical protein
MKENHLSQPLSTAKSVTPQMAKIESEPTLLPGILLSDFAMVEQGTGKKSLIGTFDQFTFPQFPATYPRFFVTAWFTNVVGKFSELELTCHVREKTSSHVVFSSTANLNFPEGATFTKDIIMGLSTSVGPITFPKPSLYTVVLLLSGEEIGQRDFNVHLASKPALPPTPTS